MGTAKIWADRQDIPGHSSELQGVWLTPTQDTPGHRRHLSPEAPCSLSQALKIKLPGCSYSGLGAKRGPGKERGSPVSPLAQRRGKDKRWGRPSAYGWSFGAGPEETKAASPEEVAGPCAVPEKGAQFHQPDGETASTPKLQGVRNAPDPGCPPSSRELSLFGVKGRATDSRG